MTVNEEKKAQVSKTIMKVNVFVFDVGVEHSHQLQLFPLDSHSRLLSFRTCAYECINEKYSFITVEKCLVVK